MNTDHPGDLAGWETELTCYTAALARLLAVRDGTWWRRLLDGGPTLAVTPAADDLLRFDHHVDPPLPALGLRIHSAETWAPVATALAEQIVANGAAIALCDVFHLPWQRGYERWHAPHWLTIVDGPDGWYVDDVLSMTTDLGPQPPRRIPVDQDRLPEWTLALPPDDPVHVLREQSVAGTAETGLGARYRWLEHEPEPTPRPDGSTWSGRAAGSVTRATTDDDRLVGTAALVALAERFRFATDPADFRQIDDLWQALRQRELLVRAALRDPTLIGPDGLRHWTEAVGAWRRLPPLLLHARMRAADGATVAGDRLADALTELAAFEGRHLAPVAARPDRPSDTEHPTDRSSNAGRSVTATVAR